jgi:hypothetical protein
MVKYEHVFTSKNPPIEHVRRDIEQFKFLSSLFSMPCKLPERDELIWVRVRRVSYPNGYESYFADMDFLLFSLRKQASLL